MNRLENNINDIRTRIKEACERCGRNTDEVTLVAVTKTVPAEIISEAVAQGLTVLGENRVTELKEKYPLIDGVEWHLIGHLQTNKVKQVIGKAKLIHSVDSERLLSEINEAAKKTGIIQDILLEVNISGEESKYGLTTEQITDIMKEMKSFENVSFKGFMTMAPLGAPEDELRSIFSKAKMLFDEYKADGAQILSMGMSGDFEVAVEEGATHVRVGSAIFKR